MTSKAESKQDIVTFDQFSEEWLRDFREGDMSPFEKGSHFASRLVSQWLEVNEDDEDMILCDGSGDGGIDIAYLHRSEVDDETAQDGHIWYLVQSKYGSAFHGKETILLEGQKVITTLCGENQRVSDKTRQLLERISIFRDQASERDRIILVFATESPMSESDRRTLQDLRTLGRDRIGNLFDVEDISLNTIWEIRALATQTPMSLTISGNFVDPSSGLRVGTIPLIEIYEFLKAYRAKTGNLDQLYEKNVRQFLGGRRKINRGIAKTLQKEPELFGLYNNGITIVVSGFSTNTSDGSCVLFDPYVVNGCQTTKTIWEVLQPKLDSGGTGHSAGVSDWRARAERGVVVTKIVKSDSAEISAITRFTNSQNAVREQDFLALEDLFGSWAEIMAERHDIFLEIQRGGWESRRAYQKSHPASRQFTEYANAFDLIKVYGAGWLREPGYAFGRNAAFLPGSGGTIFDIITKEEPIDSDDLYAAYQLQQSAKQFKFGRGKNVKPSRRVSRFFYYFVAIELLRDVLRHENKIFSSKDITGAFNALVQKGNEDALQLLLDAAIEVVDQYLGEGFQYSVVNETEYEGNLNVWMKSDALGKGTSRTSNLNELLERHKDLFGVKIGAQPSRRTLVSQAIESTIV